MHSSLRLGSSPPRYGRSLAGGGRVGPGDVGTVPIVLVSVDCDHGEPCVRNDALPRCAAPSGPVTRAGVELVQTYVSSLIFDGDLVHKRKKPVRFAFVDLSTPERREPVCHQEVELNRRFSPDVYLGVEEIVDDEGRVVDHAVLMRRMPADRRLATLVQQHREVAGCLRSIARIMAECHAGSTTSEEIASVATPEALQDLWDRNLREIDPFVPTRSIPRSSPGSGARPSLSARASEAARRAHRPGPHRRRARGPAGGGHLLPRRRSPHPRRARVRRASPLGRCAV